MVKNLLAVALSICVFFSTVNLSFANIGEQYDLTITNARIVDGEVVFDGTKMTGNLSGQSLDGN